MDHRRVLVVDDDESIRGMLASVFRRKSLTVDVASGGEAAMLLLREHSYAVVLLDLLMPDLDGFAVLDAMKTEPIAPPVVLVITGADKVIVDRLDAQRIHGVIRKPFDPEEIGAVVEACTDIRARNALDTMMIATMASANLLAWLSSHKW